MYRALILVRNLISPSSKLDFGEFTIATIKSPRLEELKRIFRLEEIFVDDWVLEKKYDSLPPAPSHDPARVGGIPQDIEDLLLILRLYKAGDVSFVRQAIQRPDETWAVQEPYRAVNSLNDHSVFLMKLDQAECNGWNAFADGLRKSQSWSASWFSVARRFFLYAGATEFNPTWDDVDRIVDYSTALEATLVPEREFLGRRLRQRAANLIAGSDKAKQELVLKLVGRMYDIRSSIVHGSVLGSPDRDWLTEHWEQTEILVREILIAAVQNVPPAKQDRRTSLSSLFDVSDLDRQEALVEKFKEIKSSAVRASAVTELSKL